MPLFLCMAACFVRFLCCPFLLFAQKKGTKEKGPLPQSLRVRSEASSQQSFTTCCLMQGARQTFYLDRFFTTGGEWFVLLSAKGCSKLQALVFRPWNSIAFL